MGNCLEDDDFWYAKVLEIERTHPNKAPIGEDFVNQIHAEKGDEGWTLSSPNSEISQAAHGNNGLGVDSSSEE